MIAVDTSSLVAYLRGDGGPDVELVERALRDRQVALPPVVLTEALSLPRLPADVAEALVAIPALAVLDGYWSRAGLLRARVLARRLRGRLADALIAQSCLDHDVPLVTRDRDFRRFARHGGLRLAEG